MTVRWKPLLIMSGLFLAVALVGVVAITVTLVPRSAPGHSAVEHEQREPDAAIRRCRDLLTSKSFSSKPRTRPFTKSSPACISTGRDPRRRPRRPRCEPNGWNTSRVRSSSTRPAIAATARAALRRDERRPDS